MKILVTGAKGFIAKNLIAELKNQNYNDIYEYDVDSSEYDLDRYAKDSEVVFHLAGVNRSIDPNDFIKGNFGLTSLLLNKLRLYKNNCPIILSSSIQAELNNPYGISKKAGEDLLISYSKDYGNRVIIYRFSNVFGKWCKPNYNSVIATFSYNINNDLPIMINDKSTIINLIYIDDVIKELINAMKGKENRIDDFCYVEPVYRVSLGYIADLLYSFKLNRDNKTIPNMEDSFVKKLYATYISYLPREKFSYDLKMNIDHRGSFTEFLKTSDRGQVSINISKPGIIKGNHWHHTKNEKFLVVSGEGVIRFRRVDEEEVIEYHVSGKNLKVLDIPPGYVHNIENIGNEEMVTVMWANEPFDPNNHDTYFMEV